MNVLDYEKDEDDILRLMVGLFNLRTKANK